MVEKNKKNDTEENINELDKNKKVKGTKPEQKQYSKIKPHTLMSLIAIIIAVLAIIESAYLSSKLRKFELTETKLTSSLNTTASQQSQQLNNVFNQLNNLKQTLQENSERIRENTASIETLKATKDLSDYRWTLIEVRYLLNLAEYHLKLIPEPQTALAILQKAEKLLEALNDPNTLTLRQNIINASTQIKSLPKVNYANILMQLNSLETQLPNMPLINQVSKGSIQTIIPKETASGWRKYWHKSLQTLEKLVIIRRQNQTVEPLISPKQHVFLIENLQSKLSQASWALLHNNQEVFQESLKSLISWINQYYDPNSTTTVNVLNTLSALQKIDLQPQLPDLSQAIQLNTTLINGAQHD